MHHRPFRLTLAALLAGASLGASAHELYSDAERHLNANVEAVFGAFHSERSYAIARGQPGSTSWREGYIKYGLSADQALARMKRVLAPGGALVLHLGSPVFHGEQVARLVASLTRQFRDISLAEEMAQDALVAALDSWPRKGVPQNPGAWLMAAAKRKAIDQLQERGDIRVQRHSNLQTGRTPSGARAVFQVQSKFRTWLLVQRFRRAFLQPRTGKFHRAGSGSARNPAIRRPCPAGRVAPPAPVPRLRAPRSTSTSG